MRLRSILGVIGFLSISLFAHADIVGLTSISGGSAFVSFNGSSDTVGWRFTANDDLTVTALGIFNPSAYSRAIANNHPVGIWDSSGNLLASVTVGPSGTSIDNSLFTSVSAPVYLTSGSTYFLGVFYVLNSDYYVTGTTSRTFSPEITYLGGSSVNSSGLVDPGTTNTTSAGRFGPNLEYTITPAAPTVPEPSSLALLGTGIVGVFGAVRRKYIKA